MMDPPMRPLTLRELAARELVPGTASERGRLAMAYYRHRFGEGPMVWRPARPESLDVVLIERQAQWGCWVASYFDYPRPLAAYLSPHEQALVEQALLRGLVRPAPSLCKRMQALSKIVAIPLLSEQA